MAKKKPAGEQLSLGKAKVSLPPPPPPLMAAPPSEPPKILEYTPPTSLEKWQVERFDLLAVYFGLSAAKWDEAMRMFHGFAEADTQRWFYIRRLFGVMPLIPPSDVQPKDLHAWTREEICSESGLSEEVLAEELAHLRIAWEGWHSEQQRHAPASVEAAIPERPVDTLEFGEDLLKRYDFDKSLFEVEVYDSSRTEIDARSSPRPAAENRAEMDWFLQKLSRPEWQRMLSDSIAGPQARTALINELYLRRFDREMMRFMPTHPKWKELSGAREKIQTQYSTQMESLNEKFPELGTAGRVSFRAAVSDLNLAHRQYYGKSDHRLWDKIHTAAEIAFLQRTSAQQPMPRYRLSWQLAVIEAMHGLYDPNFRSMMRKPDLKRLDLGYRRGIEEAKRELPDIEPNLERGVIPGEPDCDEFPEYLLKEKEN